MSSFSVEPAVNVTILKLAAGGMANMTSSGILNPVDVIKCRLQTQGQLSTKSRAELPYRGFRHAAVKIFREEGLSRGLYKGFTASMMREASYSSMRFGLYDLGKEFIAPGKTKEQFTLWQKILAGFFSGSIGSCIATPTDLVKIQYQSSTPEKPVRYSGAFNAFSTIYREGGIKALYRGVGPTTIRAAVLTGSQLATYDQTKRYLLRTPYFHDNFQAHAASAVVAALVTATVTNPVDIIKTRIMNDVEKRYRGPVHCAYSLLRKEGFRSFFKGWFPNLGRLGPHFVMALPLVEFIRKQMGLDSM